MLLRTVVAFDQDDGAVMSRSIAYYALFSFFPLLLLLLTFASSVLTSGEAEAAVQQAVARVLPVATELVAENIQQVLGARSTAGILAGVGLIWAASGVFTALYRAVNRAWGNPKGELFWTEKLYGLSVVIIVGLILVATTLVSTVVNVLRSWQLSVLGWDPFAGPGAGGWVRWVSAFLPALVSAATFIVLYRTMPRNDVTWRDVWVGGLLAGLTWEAIRQLYGWYLANFARYSLIYGSVGAIIGFLLWAYLGAMIVILGAEFTAQQTYWRRAGRPVEDRPPRQWLPEWSK